jgi:thiamine-monophosphate kinase
LPIHPIAHKSDRALDLALNGGEDYELLFAAPPTVRVPRSLAGVPIARIGRLVAGTGVTLIDASGARRRLEPAGWEHFNSKRQTADQHRNARPKRQSPSPGKQGGRLR